MRSPAMALAAVLMVRPASTRSEPPARTKKTVGQLYAAHFPGPWGADGGKARLGGLWLHRNEKGRANRPNEGLWRINLNFAGGGPEGFRGTPEKVEADGDGLKITLPPAGKGEGRKTRVLRIQRAGNKLKVRVIGGRFEGAYELKRVPSKQ